MAKIERHLVMSNSKIGKMVRKLFLIRHADAEESSREVKDFDRQLMRIGYQHAAHVGNYLANESIHPDLMICSTAARARQTAETIADHIKYDYSRIRYQDDLYEASVRIMLGLINQLEDNFKVVVMVAHNPSISFLADYLTQENIGNMMPAGICTIEFEGLAWKEVSQNTGILKAHLSPDELQ